CLPSEIRTIFPAAIAYPIRPVSAPTLTRRGARPPELDVGSTVILHRSQMPPAPHERFVGPQDHVHRRIAHAIPASFPRCIREKQGSALLIDLTTIRIENT